MGSQGTPAARRDRIAPIIPVRVTQASNSRRPKWATPVVMVILTTVVLMGLLQVISQLGAKSLLERMADGTLEALRSLQPLALGRRYVAILADVMNPCTHASFSDLQRCYQEHRVGQQTFPEEAIQLLKALWLLVREIFSESWAAAIVDALQLVAGFSLATYIGARFNLLRAEYSYVLMLLYVPFGILCTCLLSLPMLGVLFLASKMFGEVLPAPIHISLYAGCWCFSLACTSRVFESLLHHRLGGFIERVLTRR